MFRLFCVGLVLSACCAAPVLGQGDPASIEAYFTGRQVVMKVDMPGTQKGVDLKYDKPTPMDWNDYTGRMKSFGVSLHKGEVARVTKINVKGDMIEFQLNGGGYGTAGEDTITTVSATPVPKSQYEKDLEKQLTVANLDPKHRGDLQHQLDVERTHRAQIDAQNQNNATIATQVKTQEIMQRRMTGGSRFNLRWKDTIPSDDRNPQAVMALLTEYIDFNPASVNAAPAYVAPQPAYAPAPQQPAYVQQPAYAPPPPASYGPPDQGNWNAGTASSQLKRGLKMGEVGNLLGRGRMVSETVSQDGLKTQVMEYASQDSLADVTFVEGVVVRYSISSK